MLTTRALTAADVERMGAAGKREVAEKIALYEQAGVPLLWVVRPRRRAVEVRLHGSPPDTLNDGDTLDGGDIVPGFRLPVADIFR